MSQPRRRARFALLGPLLACLGADAPPPKGYVCSRAAGPIAVDGKLDDPAWAAVPWTDDFVDIEGDARPRPRFRTRAKLAWDDRCFYVAAELAEPHAWGTLKDHDAVIFADNDFEVFLDPDGDNHDYYELEINALNTEWDLFLDKPYRDGGPARNAWEIPGLRTAVAVQGTLNDPTDVDRSWTVELAIPWKAIDPKNEGKGPPADGDRWRVNFSRVEWEHQVEAGRYRKVAGRREDNWVWSPQGVVDMHRPERWGYVQFSDRPAGEVAFRPDPTGPARDRLMAVYQAQKDRQSRKLGYAPTWADLGLAGPTAGPGLAPIRIEATADGYRARLPLDPPGSPRPRSLQVRQDSRLTVERD